MTGRQVARKAPQGIDEKVLAESERFAAVLPSHIRSETWVRLAVGCLRQSKDLMTAATSDPPALWEALLDAARLGLEPGSDEYYLTPRKRGGKPSILGIVGYQGEIELIYRAGAVKSVVAQLVCERDTFQYTPGLHDRPIHQVSWFDDRGPVLGAYAYGVMDSGAISRVAMIGPQEIQRAMSASATADKDTSPWKTDYGAMVLKTAVHQLAKWVPTSAEYRQVVTATAERENPAAAGLQPAPRLAVTPTAAVDDQAVTDAEIVDIEDPPTGEAGGQTHSVAPVSDTVDVDPDTGEITTPDEAGQ